MKYYIYKSTNSDGQKLLYFVPNPEAFAKSNHNPLSMEFTDVAVIAPTIEEAREAYENPCNTKYEIVSCDEPEATANQREAMKNAVNENISLLSVGAAMATLATEMEQMFRSVASSLANTGTISEKKAYNLVKKTFLKALG